MELPRRTRTADRASADAAPASPTERTSAAAPQVVGGRFDRGLRRVTREQTSLLSWLAESNQAEVLRRPAPIDLRDEAVIDVRDEPAEAPGTEADAVDKLATGSLFQR